MAKGQNSGKRFLVSPSGKKYGMESSYPGSKPTPEFSIFTGTVAAGMAAKQSDNRTVQGGAG